MLNDSGKRTLDAKGGLNFGLLDGEWVAFGARQFPVQLGQFAVE